MRLGQDVVAALRRPDARNHSPTHVGRNGAPTKIISKVTLRQKDLGTIRIHLGTMSETGSIGWLNALCREVKIPGKPDVPLANRLSFALKPNER